MTTVTIAAAQAQLGELIERVEQGELIEIVRHGRPVARLSPVIQGHEPIDFDWLQSVVDQMPRTSSGAVRQMRDEDRY